MQATELAIAKMILVALASCSIEIKTVVHLHHKCEETSRVAWIVPRIASTHELACYARTGEVNPRNRYYVSDGDGLQLLGTYACFIMV